MYGSDTEFCAWLRTCKELPSVGADFGLSASDNDITLHRYKTCIDSQGTREVQAIMQLEVKTRRGKPPAAQMDTLSKLNLFSGSKKVGTYHLRFFGVFLLVMSGTTPDNSDDIFWGAIPAEAVLTDASKCKWRRISRSRLIQLLRFDIHPVNFASNPFRRHHKTAEFVEIVKTELGFETEQRFVRRS
jgi:hypothetical protein